MYGQYVLCVGAPERECVQMVWVHDKQQRVHRHLAMPLAVCMPVSKPPGPSSKLITHHHPPGTPPGWAAPHPQCR